MKENMSRPIGWANKSAEFSVAPFHNLPLNSGITNAEPGSLFAPLSSGRHRLPPCETLLFYSDHTMVSAHIQDTSVI
jgi:hypothetical protein